MRLRRSIVVVVGMLGLSATLPAQSPDRTGLVRIPYTSYIGLNPLIIPFDLGSVELESGVAQGTTVGGSASYLDIDDDRFTSVDFKLRYYPGEVVLRGFSIGLSGGFLRYSVPASDTTRSTLETPTVGIVTDYNWLLGGNKRFLIGTGLGAKRVLSSKEKREAVDLARAYVTARFIVGLAF